MIAVIARDRKTRIEPSLSCWKTALVLNDLEKESLARQKAKGLTPKLLDNINNRRDRRPCRPIVVGEKQQGHGAKTKTPPTEKLCACGQCRERRAHFCLGHRQSTVPAPGFRLAAQTPPKRLNIQLSKITSGNHKAPLALRRGRGTANSRLISALQPEDWESIKCCHNAVTLLSE